MESKESFSLAEACEYLGMKPRALRDACRAQRITYSKLDRRTWRFSRAELDAFVQRNTVQARTVYGPKPPKKPRNG